jgi:hypothetical protein
MSAKMCCMKERSSLKRFKSTDSNSILQGLKRKRIFMITVPFLWEVLQSSYLRSLGRSKAQIMLVIKNELVCSAVDNAPYRGRRAEEIEPFSCLRRGGWAVCLFT